MRAPGKAVVADDTVRDEVARSGRDVDHVDLGPQVLDADHVEVSRRLDRGVSNRELSRDGRPRQSGRSAARKGRRRSPGRRPPHSGGPARTHAGCDSRLSASVIRAQNRWTFVHDSEDSATVRPLGVEHSRKKARVPGAGPSGRRRYQLFYLADSLPPGSVDRRHLASRWGGRDERPGVRHDPLLGEELSSSIQCLGVGERKPEAMDFTRACCVRIGAVKDHSVATNHPRQISAAV